MLLGLYRASTGLATPLLRWHLGRRARRGKEDPSRLSERYGGTVRARPDGALLWIHAASVGESLATLPLIDRLLEERPYLHILVTTGTVTSAGLMAERLPPKAIHQFAPIDSVSAWRRFFAHWRPSLGCLVESEIWPNLITEAESARLPLILVNGRMSKRSAARWRWAGKAASRLFRSFELCLARNEDDAKRFEDLGASDVRCLGDLKNAAPPLPADLAELDRLRSTIGDRPIWLAASTHPGEERAIATAHDLMRKVHPDLLTILAPRHPERGAGLRSELRPTSGKLAQRSAGEEPDPQTGLYLADTLGELGLFYRLAKIAFIGGSLVPHGGQNPLEAARLGCPPIFGPHTGNFEVMTANLIDAGAARRIRDAGDLADTVSALLSDEAALDHLVARAREAGLAEEAVLDRMLDAINPLLDRQIGLSRQTVDAVHACA